MSDEYSVKEKINNQIDVDKEILSVLPKNNKKNLQEYKNKAGEIKGQYENYLDEIISEIKRRALRIKSINEDPKIKKLEQEISYMDKIKLLDKNATSFEKMELDEILFILKICFSFLHRFPRCPATAPPSARKPDPGNSGRG